MSRYVYDKMYDDAERLRKDFEEAKDTEDKQRILRSIQNVAHEFADYADDLDTFVEEKENEMVESEEI